MCSSDLSNLLATQLHVFFVIEGFRNNRRFIIKADLVKFGDGGLLLMEHARVRVHSWRDYADFQKKAAGFQAQQYEIKAAVGMEFVESLHGEMQTEYKYSLLSTADNDTETCVTWVQKMLGQLNVPPSNKWYNTVFVLPTDVVSIK